MRCIQNFLMASVFCTSFAAAAAPTVKTTDLRAKRIEMSAEATINDYCLYGKNEAAENFILCTLMVGDMSRGIYKLQTPDLRFAIPGLVFQVLVDPESLEAGELTYIFLEQEIETPALKPSGQFFDQVKKAISDYGPARLDLLYIGEAFDTSLFGTPVPLLQ